MLQTRSALLFFAGTRVYRLARPSALAPAEEESLEERRARCEEEVRLNRRLSSRAYRGVLPVTLEPGGQMHVGGPGQTVDWVVEMTRLPAGRMLDVLIEGNEVREDDVVRLALALARFHDRAMTGPSVNRQGLPRTIAQKLRSSLDALDRARASSPGILSHHGIDLLRGASEGFLESRRDLLERRVAEWRIRDGHGDLRAEHVCLLEDEAIVYDCVLDDRRARYGDVACDMATLALDLDDRGRPDLADFLVRTYAEVASDPDFEALVDFYKIWRGIQRSEAAMVRGEAVEAARIAQLALGYVLPTSVLVVRGAPAEDPSGAEVVRRVAGSLRALALCEPAGNAGPAAEVEELLQRAGGVVAAGGRVVFGVPREVSRARDELLEIAAVFKVQAAEVDLPLEAASDPGAPPPSPEELGRRMLEALLDGTSR